MMYKENRTSAYRFTVDMKGGKPANQADLQALTSLREYYEIENAIFGTTYYVKLQGRGPRKVNGKKYFQSLPLKYATSADVYVYERYNG